MLGNLLCFLLTSVSHSGLLFATLDRSQHWIRWGGEFQDVLPALVDAHGMVLAKFTPALHKDICEETLRIIDRLCYPDPRLRGDEVARRQGQNPYRLGRFVTRLDLLHKRASLTVRASV
jgi:hypothetical protein